MRDGPERIIEMPGAVKVRLTPDLLIFESGGDIEHHRSKEIYTLEVPGSATLEEGILIISNTAPRDEIPKDFEELRL